MDSEFGVFVRSQSYIYLKENETTETEYYK